MSNFELTSMLDSLESTLTRFTIPSFFTRYGKNPHKNEISIEAVMCLEAKLGRPDSGWTRTTRCTSRVLAQYL